uniref:Uncharacterized protein n=1 Tax=Arundo donax TaxID=35708 RepID=A0A0A8Z262_ARUDO
MVLIVLKVISEFPHHQYGQQVSFFM